MDSSFNNLISQFVTSSYSEHSLNTRRTRTSLFKTLLAQRKLPKDGLSSTIIKNLLNELSLMDSNNHINIAGAGEREGRVYNDLVKFKNYDFSHGIGRSGDIYAIQPKAIGSSLMNILCNSLVLHALKLAGCKNAKECLILPLATGMAHVMTLLTLKRLNDPKKIYYMAKNGSKNMF